MQVVNDCELCVMLWTRENIWSFPAKNVHGMLQAVIPKEIILTRNFCVDQVMQLDKSRRAKYSAYQKKGNPFSKAHCSIKSQLIWIFACGIQVKSNIIHPLSIGTIFASCMSRMTEHIVIFNGNVISHFLQVLWIG